MLNKSLLIAISLVIVMIAGLFSGAETGMYQLSRVRLRIGIEKRKLAFVMLGKVVHDGPAMLLTTLIGNNLAHYFATSIVTTLFLASVDSPHTAEVLTTVVTTPVFFVFSELVPKSLFYYRADTLMPYTAPLLLLCQSIFRFSGAIPALKAVSNLFARLFGSDGSSAALIAATPRHHISAVLAESREEGLLSRVQLDIVNRLVAIPRTHLRAVMTPISRALTIDVRSDRNRLLEVLGDCPFTRLPVYEDRPENIIGFINIYDALAGEEAFGDLRALLKPIHSVPSETTVTEAIEIMKSQARRVMLVTRKTHTGRTSPAGIVTMKDLAEELIGELGEW